MGDLVFVVQDGVASEDLGFVAFTEDELAEFRTVDEGTHVAILSQYVT